MNRTKRKDILYILNSGWSAINISNQISQILQQPQEEILKIIHNLHWNRTHILKAFDNFPQAKTPYKEAKQ